MNFNKILHGPNMAGQSIMDRVTSAKYSIAGQGLAKCVAKATTEELNPPKKKHIDYLIQCSNENNVSIPYLSGTLFERTQIKSWVVVCKALLTTHSLLNHGNERFIQYLASNNISYNLENFTDKTTPQGYDMSTYIRKYSKYINEKCNSYRIVAYDFCKIRKGCDDGLLRTLDCDKLLKTLPVLQNQVDALVEFEVATKDLNNLIIKSCFIILFKDLIRLLACYNDAIINLLAKFFDMNKKDCKEALDIYKKFISRMETVEKFFKSAEDIGIDKGNIPDLAQAPSTLIDALEEHVKTFDKKKSKKGAINIILNETINDENIENNPFINNCENEILKTNIIVPNPFLENEGFPVDSHDSILNVFKDDNMELDFNLFTDTEIGTSEEDFTKMVSDTLNLNPFEDMNKE